jgi:hypothetical protein
MLIQVYTDTIEAEISQTPIPILLACIHPDAARKPYQELLEGIEVGFPDQVKVCLLQEEIDGMIGKKYGIAGTPMFLMVHGARVIARLLGEIDLPVLRAFITQNIPSSVRSEE